MLKLLLLEYLDDIFDHVDVQEKYLGMVDEFYDFAGPLTEVPLQHPNVRKLLESNEHFDLVFMEVFVNDAFLGKYTLQISNVSKITN